MNRGRTFAMQCITALVLAGASVSSGATPPPDPAPPPLQLPVPLERALANGLRVVVLPSARAPIVHVQLLVPAGSAYEPADQPGVAFMTSQLLRQGTPSRTADEVDTDLAQAGASLATSCGLDYAQVAAGGREESMEGLLEVVSDVVINPLFGADRFDDLRLQLARNQAAQLGSLEDAADARILKLGFAPHPYSHNPSAEPQSVLGVGLAAVQGFHRDRWRPDRAVLVIAGDVTPDRAFGAAEEWFGRWSGHTAPDRVRPAAQPPAGIRIVDVPRANHAAVRVAVTGPGVASPDHASWMLAETALENSPLPAGVGVSLESARDASLLVLSQSGDTGDAAAAVKRLLGVLADFVAHPPAGASLDSLRRRVRQHYPLTIGSLGAFVSRWQDLDFAGKPAGAIATLGETQAAASLDAGLRALGGTPRLLVAGSAEALAGPLAAFGAVEVEPLVPPRPTAAAIAAEALPPGTPEQRRRGRAAVTAAVLAHGGPAALAAARSSVHEGTITFKMGQQELAGLYSAVRVDPDKYSFSTRVLQLESRQAYVGDRGWSMTKTDSTVITDLDSLGVVKLKLASSSDLVHELRTASGPGGDPVWRGTAVVSSRKCDLVDFATPFGRQRLAIDAITHRVLELAASPGAKGTWLDHRFLSDFRRVNGLLLPHAEDRSVQGEHVWRITAKGIGVNQPIPANLFERPATPH